MAEFNEHVLKVRAALDKASQREIRETLRDIFVEEAHVDFNNPENIKGLRELTEAMKKIFAQAGNTKFDFAKMIQMPGPEMFNELKKAAMEFDTVWSSIVSNMGNVGDSISQGIADGIASGVENGIAVSSVDIAKQLDSLSKRKNELHKQSMNLDKRLSKYERLSEISSMEYDEFKPLPLSKDGDIDEQAQQIMGAFIDAEDALNEATRGTDEYNNALIKALEAAENLYRMSHTLNNNKGLVKDKTLLSDFDFINLSDVTADVFDRADVDFNKILRDVTEDYQKQVKTITTELGQIEISITSLQKKKAELIDVENVNTSLKSVKEIEEAYNRMLYKEGEVNKVKERISSALEYTPGGESLAVLSNRYKKSSLSNEDWETQYQWLIKFVKEYENYSEQIKAESDGLKRRNMRARQRRYDELYESLKPFVGDAENALKRVLDVVDGKPLVNADAISDDVTNTDNKRLQEEADAHRQNAEAIRDESVAQEELNNIRSNTTTTALFDSYNQSSGEAKNALQEYADLFGKANQLREISEGRDLGISGIYFGATEEQLNDVVAAWREYRAVMQEIASIQINTEDDEKKLMELQARAVGLYNTFKQGRLNDSLAEGYVDHYGVSEEDAIKMRSDMDIGYGGVVKDFSNSLAKMSNKGGEILNIIEQLDKSLYNTLMQSSNDDLITTFDLISRSAVNADHAVVDLSESLEHTQQLTSGIVTSATDGMSISDSDAEIAKVESLQSELDKKKAELTEKDNEIQRIQSEKDSAIQAANDEKLTLQNDLDVANAQIKIAQDSESAARAREFEANLKLSEKDEHIKSLEERLANSDSYYNDSLWEAENRANEAEEKVALLEKRIADSFGVAGKQGFANAEELRGVLESITYNTKVIQDTDLDENNKISINEEALEAVLKRIVYNVKITYDNSDKTANKIALDDASLESTLTKVFAGILNPQTQQNDSEQKQTPWALENTLQNVKGVLDNIQTNTSRIGVVENSNVDAIAGTELDNKLTQIKSVLESIEQKIVDGGKIVNRDGAKQAYKDSQDKSGATGTSRANTMKSLISDYKTLGKLSAQFANESNLETRAMLDNLKEEIARKRRSLKLTADENKSLREKYSIAFNAEKRLLDAAKTQKAIDDKNKSAEKDAKKQAKDAEMAWKKQVKDAQRSTGINAATTAANSGDQTVVRAIGTGGISKDIENKAKELSDKIKALRALRDQIDKRGSQASDVDRDKLSKQISSVKELKSELDEYLKIHEKYSGDNVTDIGDASNFGAVGTDQYWNNITAAIKSVSDGRVDIKAMNADTGELTGTTKIAANTFATWSATVDPLTGRLSMLRTGIKKTETIVESITRKTKEIFTYFSGSSIIFKVFNELKRGIQYVRDIDLALTELKKVTNETEETYRKFLDTASKTAAKVGSTIKDVVSSTADWARLGYSMEQAAKFAETTQILMNVSEFTDVSQATDTLISAVQAFGYTAETSMDVVDLLNTIGNNYAISTADLAQSLTKSSASLVAAGGDLAEAAALTATANKIIQDADSVGTALKTTSLRLRGTDVKVLEEEGLDSEGVITSKSKLQSKVKALSGVDILTATGEYKSTYQILSQIADVWKDINDMDQAALLELLAGKRNSSVLAAILQNPQELKDAYEDANNAQGSALKENEKYIDSIQGKIDQFNNAVQTLWNDTLDSDVVKFLVDLATQLVKIVDAVGPLNIAIVGLFTYLQKQHGIFDNIFKPAEDGIEELKKQLVKAERDLAKAEDADLRRSTNRTAEKRRNAEERVNILRQRVQKASEEAVLDGIDESFDPEKVKNSIRGKKSARTKRINQLQAEGKTFDEIRTDDKVQQYTRDIEEAEQALNEYNTTVQQTNATTQQASATTRAYTAANQANATSNLDAAESEAADAAATNASAAADIGATAATSAHTTATWADVWAEITRAGATGSSVLATIKQVLATKLATSALVQKGAAEKGVMATDLATLSVTKLLTLGFYGLVASIKVAIATMWEFMTTTPIGWVLLAVAAIAALGAAFSAMHKTTEELKEELDGFKSSLSDIRSELDSINSELETTNERMEELLAKDKLTFEEQEELDRLRATNDELERRKELLEDEEEYKSGLVGRQAARVVESARTDYESYAGGLVRSTITNGAKASKNISEYKNIKEQFDNASTIKEQEKYRKELDEKAAKIDEYILELSEALDGVEYGDSEESDEALDYLAKLQDDYGIARGLKGSKTNAIKNIMKKEEFSSMSNAIDYYVKSLEKGEEDAADAISTIINGNEDFISNLASRGLNAQDVIDLYTNLGESLNFGTIEGKTEELSVATEKLLGVINDVQQFMDGDKVDTSAIAEYFKGTSKETREEIAKLIQQIYDSDVDVENALKQFEAFKVRSKLVIEIDEVQTDFKDIFTDLEGADGLVDTFNELANAIGSTSKAMDALNAAQGEMAYSGRVSIETALQLMEYTDDYSKVLTVSEGNLVLTKDAEENLIDARIEGMKASALKALEDAKAARETMAVAKSTAETALSTYNSSVETELAAAVTASAWDKVLAAAAGLLAGIKSLLTDESWTEAYDRAYQDTINSRGEDRVTEVQNKYASVVEKAKKAQLEQDVADAEKAMAKQDDEIQKLQGNYDLISGLNKDNIGDVFKSDDIEDADDAKKTQLEEAMDRFQQEMDYWENRIGANQAKYEQLQNEIDLLEAKGQKSGAEYYREQIKLENDRLWLLQQQKAEAEKFLGTMTEGSDEWWEVANTLNDIESELDDVTSSILDLQDAIGEIDTYKFEEFNTRLDNLVNKLGTIRDLIAPDGEDDWFDSEGNWTDAGIAVAGTYLQELETYKQGYQETMDELAKYEPDYEGNESYYESLGIHSEQEYYDKTEELISQQYEFAESISDTEQSVVDMYESSIDAVDEYVEKLIDGYGDYIDSVKEALDAERDLYDFKKNVQKQAKDIGELERRIVSLSGSTNKSDIAERRKLEAQLYESRESLNDAYYDHAKDSVDDALSSEQQAYEETMTKIVANMRVSLEEATTDMAAFLDSVTIAVSMNADTVLAKYRETEVPLNDAITNPWEEAAKRVAKYGGDANNLMDVWKKDGYFAEFKITASTNLSSPWNSGTTAANAFKTSVSSVMSNVVSNIASNVKSASGELSKLYQQIKDTEARAASANVTVNSGGSDGGGSGGNGGYTQKKYYSTATLDIGTAVLTSKGVGSSKSDAEKNALEAMSNNYYNYKISHGAQEDAIYGLWSRTKSKIKYNTQYYAKGTIGTTSNEWAITDEPQFGDELVLVPTAQGNLSYMRKGTSVVPAAITENLMEWGQFTPDSFNLGGGVNVNMINNAVNKPEFNFAFDALVKAERIDENTLPEVKRFVQQEINSLVKQMNYAIKGKGGR